MRKFVRTLIARTGHDSDVWPVVLLLFAVLVPAVCLLWFMNAAMRNERFAVRQKLTDVYQGQLAAASARLERHWQDIAGELEELARAEKPSIAFLKCIQAGKVDSVILFDEQGRTAYPNSPASLEAGLTELPPKWAEASQFEYLRRDFFAAAKSYHELAEESTDTGTVARALQAEARCLVHAGQKEAAIRLITETLGQPRFRHTADPQGRLIVANAELMALELMTNRAAPAFAAMAQRLQLRLVDYDNPALAAPQRRFLMKELQSLSSDLQFPTLTAEELAAQPPAQRAEICQFATPNHRVLVLVRADTLRSALQTVTVPNLAAEAQISLLSPGTESSAAFVSLPAGALFPGWRLALNLDDQSVFTTAAKSQITIYLWSGMLVVAAMAVLALLAIRLLRRQTALARLKNDLAATVSHELKTPLASMRVLVDTLLDSEALDEKTTREYLQLIAQENERLSRLIQNFLAFSRMERRKYTFHFATVPAREIADAAIASVRQRFDVPDCRFETQLDDRLPAIQGDADALVAALINLLDNAHKFAGGTKHIVLRVHIDHGKVFFSVKDNGVGIASRDAERIFQPFHQIDQRLSRNGSGCGLGLSIVRYIMKAHGGHVTVASQPGRGSTFTLSLPVAEATVRREKEAIA